MGVDPGSQYTGFGVIELQGESLMHKAHGVIVLEGKTFHERIRELGESFQQVLAQYRPEAVVIEKIFLGKNADSAFKLGHARGVIMYQSAQAGAEIYEYATRIVKKGITGHGGADKLQVQAVVQTLLRLNQIKALDASDALAMACYHVNALRTKHANAKANVKRRERELE